MSEKPYIGGQAVIEGVMMRAPGCLTVAVRRPDGRIALREGPLTSRFATAKWAKWPGIRGVAMLVESMGLGMDALLFSAKQQETEDGELEAETSPFFDTLLMLASTALAIGMFIALPQVLAGATASLLGLELGLADAGFHALVGLYKLIIFALYLTVVGRTQEMRKVFQYHGAEHKTIHAFEQGLPLTVENVQKQTTLHPRCGTTFLVVVIVFSIILGSAITPILLPNAEGALGHVQVFALRLALLPLIAAMSYEFQRFSARYCTTGPLRVLLMPGFLFQKITTREPEDDQVEIAIAAMRAAEWREAQAKDAPTSDEPLLFDDFTGFLDALPTLRT